MIDGLTTFAETLNQPVRTATPEFEPELTCWQRSAA